MAWYTKLLKGALDTAPSGFKLGADIAQSRAREGRAEKTAERAANQDARLTRQEIQTQFDKLENPAQQRTYVNSLKADSSGNPEIAKTVLILEGQLEDQRQTEGIVARDLGELAQSDTASVQTALQAPIGTTPEELVSQATKYQEGAVKEGTRQSEILSGIGTAKDQEVSDVSSLTTAFQESSDIGIRLEDKSAAFKQAATNLQSYVALGEQDFGKEAEIVQFLRDSGLFSNKELDTFASGIRAAAGRAAAESIEWMVMNDASSVTEEMLASVHQYVGAARADFMRLRVIEGQRVLEGKKDADEDARANEQMRIAVASRNLEAVRAAAKAQAASSDVENAEEVYYSAALIQLLPLHPGQIAEFAAREIATARSRGELQLLGGAQAVLENIIVDFNLINESLGVESDEEAPVGQVVAGTVRALASFDDSSVRARVAQMIYADAEKDFSPAYFEAWKSGINRSNAPEELKILTAEDPAAPADVAKPLPGPPMEEMSQALISSIDKLTDKSGVEPAVPRGKPGRSRGLVPGGPRRSRTPAAPPSDSDKLLPGIPVEGPQGLKGPERAMMVTSLKAAGVTDAELKTITLNEAKARLKKGALPGGLGNIPHSNAATDAVLQ